MGCDIHTTLVVRDKNTNKYSPLTVSTNYKGTTATGEVPCSFRNYKTFGMLASGVRGNDFKFSIPIRGKFAMNLVENTEHSAVNHYYNGKDWHSHTFVTRDDLVTLYKRLRKFIKKQQKERNTIEAAENVEDITWRIEDITWWIEDLNNSKRIIRDMIIETDYVVELGRFGTNFAFEAYDWVLLVAFDS